MVALPEVSDILIFEEKREMLMEISSLITPEVYEVICRMGHMDELVIADANYFAPALSGKVVFSYAPENHVLLAEILKYFPLDDDEEFPINVMTPDHVHIHEPQIWNDYQNVLARMYDSKKSLLNKISRQEFYLRTKNAYATIQTSDPRLYADIILKKGVVL
jgi:L-fucose mutarotase